MYPLLAARKNHWKFTATETDDVNFDCAVKNVQENHLEESIKGEVYVQQNHLDESIKNIERIRRIGLQN